MEPGAKADPSTCSALTPGGYWYQGPSAEADTARDGPGLGYIQGAQSGDTGDGARNRSGDKAKTKVQGYIQDTGTKAGLEMSYRAHTRGLPRSQAA